MCINSTAVELIVFARLREVQARIWHVGHIRARIQLPGNILALAVFLLFAADLAQRQLPGDTVIGKSAPENRPFMAVLVVLLARLAVLGCFLPTSVSVAQR